MKKCILFFKKMLSVFNRKQKIQLLLLLIGILISALLELVGVTIILPFINIVINPDVIFKSDKFNYIYDFFRFRNKNEMLIFIALCIMGTYIIKNAYLIYLNNLQFKFSYDNQRSLAYHIASIYMSQDYLFHTKHNRSELMRDINNDTSMFFRVVLCVLQVITDGCVCIVLLAFLLITDKTITISMGFLMGCFVLFYVKFFKNKIKYYGEYTRKKQTDMVQSLLQSLGGIKEIKIQNKETYFVKKFDDAYKDYAEYLRKNNLLAVIPKPLVETLCISGIMLIVSFKLFRGTNVKYFAPTLTAFAVAAFRILPSFNRMTANLNAIIFGKPSADAVYDTMQKIKKLKETDTLLSDNENIEFENSITVRDVVFKYPSVERNVLEKVSLEIPKNKSVAFIGPSGAGKTTLADIVLGVLQPTEGKILVDETDISDKMKSWQKKLGYIPQSIYLFDDTIRRNVAMGLPDEQIDEERVWQAVRSAQLEEHILRMDKGLDTVIGENGMRLSGGQRQRIGIARALYNNPDILILDEATSALDNDTEAAVMDAINNLAGTKTLIIIAHRLSTIEKCDIVFEIKDKKVTVVKH